MKRILQKEWFANDMETFLLGGALRTLKKSKTTSMRGAPVQQRARRRVGSSILHRCRRGQIARCNGLGSVVLSPDAPAPALPLVLKPQCLEHARVTSMRGGDAGGIEGISLDDLGALFLRIRNGAF